MAIAQGDILQITDISYLDTNQIINVFFYRVTVRDVDTAYDDVASCYLSDVQNFMLPLQHNTLYHTNLVIRNLTNGVDIYEEVTNNVGLAGGEACPNFVSYGFRLVRTDASTRHGSKRVGGLSESGVIGNTAPAAFTASLNACAAAFAADITFPGSGTDEFTGEPVIVGRFPAASPMHGQLDLGTINPVAACQYVRITSQTSRRKGRGR